MFTQKTYLYQQKGSLQHMTIYPLFILERSNEKLAKTRKEKNICILEQKRVLIHMFFLVSEVASSIEPCLY